MTRYPLLLSVLLPALVGGCMGTQNRGLESVHQAVVARQDYPLDLDVTPDGLARGEAQRLRGWLDAMRLRYGDKVAVDDPASLRGPHDDVARVVAGFGMLLDGAAPITPAAVAPGTVRVVVSRMTATVPGCPDYTRDSSIEFDANTSSNFGCGTNASLTAMIANPADLLHGEGDSGTTDPLRAAKSIEAFRKAAPTGNGGAGVAAAPAAGGK